MKKTLAAVAILGAFAGSAMADVTVYGIVDLGLGYTHADDGTDKVTMESGMDSANRVGFLASEKIGDVTVGVKLENSFKGDTGADGAGGFFNRETRLYVQGAYGEVGFGRFGALDSTTGPYNLAGSSIHATTGINGIAKSGVVFLGENSRLANAIAYKSPKFGGAQVYAMYATEEGDENTHEGDRYYGLGVRYTAGALTATLVASLEDGGDTAPVAATNTAAAVPHAKGKETKAYTAAVSYDFGVTKLMGAVQYFDNAQASVHALADATVAAADKKIYVDGYGVTLSAVTPLAGGTLKTQVGYMDAEGAAVGATDEYDAWNVGALYYYDFSKRTTVYGGVGYTVQGEKGLDDYKTVNAALGLIHKF